MTTREESIRNFNSKSNLEKIKSNILDINHYTYTMTTNDSYKKELYHMQGFMRRNNIKGLAADICDSILKYRKASDKQAWILAKTLDENGYVAENL